MAETCVIPNSLVDVVLMIGLDDDTNLQPVSKIENGGLLSAVNIDYEPQVLVVASASDMVKFHPFPQKIAGYPPEKEIYHRDLLSDLKGQTNRLRSIRSTNMKMLSRHVSVKRPGSNKSAVQAPIPELPISEEVIRSIPSLCFPDGMKVNREKQENSVHFLVLTDMTGSKSYACCLTFSRRFLVEKDDQGYFYMSFEPDRTITSHEDKLYIYIPHCFVTISQYPYYSKMKECLSSMINYVEKDEEELFTFLKLYSHILTNTPVPPAGNVAVELNLNQLPVILKPTPHADKPVIDFPLHHIFLSFRVEEFLIIIAYVLQEERLVFMSSNYSLLTLIMETVRHMILPFEWRFTYVPILPSNGLGYLQAPGTFMFGCHSKHREEVEQIDGLVLVDVDQGTVTVNPDPNNSDNKNIPIPWLPREAAKMFVETSPQFKLHLDIELLRRPCFYSLEELKQFKRKRECEVNETITQACLELLVNLFRGVVSNLRVEQRYFNKEQFLNQFTGKDRSFYEKVLKTDMFKKFLEDRMDEKKDCWSTLEMKTRGYMRRASFQTSNRYPDIHLSRRQSSLKMEVRELEIFKLPDVTNSKRYIEDCLKKLSTKIKECPDYDDRMSYTYLRSMFNMAAHQNMAAMEDFISLSSSIMKILPVNNLCEVYNRLDEVDRGHFMKIKGHNTLLDVIEATESADEHSEHRVKKIRMDPISIPEKDLKYEEFVEYVYLQNMSDNYDTIGRLFEALTIGATNTRLPCPNAVDQFTFASCVEQWMNNRHQCSHVKFDEDRLQEDEVILKVSNLIKTDYGLGRIGLTDKRLFFLLNVTNKYSEIAKLQDIVKLEKSQYYGLLKSAIDILLIHRKDKTVFNAFLKEERNWWYLLIDEMWSGKRVARETMDFTAMEQAAQNTLLIDAVIGSGQDDLTAHSKLVDEAASKLCYFTKCVAEGKHILSKVTRKALQTKLDPNIGERERKTIQALLYSGGGDGTVSPKLWCGLSDGKIKVYNAATWTLEGNPLLTKQTVACLTAVDDGHVWAGSYGIYIISTETVTITKTLQEHQDMVVDIVLYNNNRTGKGFTVQQFALNPKNVLYDDNRYVYSASLDGTIIKWDVKKLTMVQPAISLIGRVKCLRSLKIHDDKLFCGSWSSVLMCDLKGTVLSQFQARESNKVVELDSFIILPSGEMWTGCRRDSWIYTWDIDSGQMTGKVQLPSDNVSSGRGVSIMEQTDDQVWVGTKEGTISVFSMKSKQACKTLTAHDDAVRVLCPVTDRYIVSGGGSIDGRVCVWSLLSNVEDSGRFT